MKSVKLIECITTWSGEGISRGKKCLLVRFKHCSRHCIFCDTQVKMRALQEADYFLKDLQTLISKENRMLMITGGEPTFGENLLSTITLINELDSNKFEVETNGHQLQELISKVHPDKYITYVLSPKLFNDEDMKFYKNLVTNIKYNNKVIIKLVSEDRPEIYEFLDFLVSLGFDSTRLWLMPEGTTSEELLKHAPFVFDLCEKYSANFSSRDHIIYGFV
jgi:7-carboxy-7-deazaguanine synthase